MTGEEGHYRIPEVDYSPSLETVPAIPCWTHVVMISTPAAQMLNHFSVEDPEGGSLETMIVQTGPIAVSGSTSPYDQLSENACTHKSDGAKRLARLGSWWRTHHVCRFWEVCYTWWMRVYLLAPEIPYWIVKNALLRAGPRKPSA